MIFGNHAVWGPLAYLVPSESAELLQSEYAGFGREIRKRFDPHWGAANDDPELDEHLHLFFDTPELRDEARAWVSTNPEQPWPETVERLRDFPWDEDGDYD